MSEAENVHELAVGGWLQVSDGIQALRIATRDNDWEIDSANGCHYGRRLVGDVTQQLYVCPTSHSEDTYAVSWGIKPNTRVVMYMLLIIVASFALSIVVPLVLGAGWWTILIAVADILILPSIIRLTLGRKYRADPVMQEHMKDLVKSLEDASVESCLGASVVASAPLHQLIIAASAIQEMCESAERYYAKDNSEMGEMYSLMAKKQCKEAGLLPESAMFLRALSITPR